MGGDAPIISRSSLVSLELRGLETRGLRTTGDVGGLVNGAEFGDVYEDVDEDDAELAELIGESSDERGLIGESLMGTARDA